MEEPLEKEEARIGRESYEKMLDEYYTLRGWDLDGVPSKEKIKELDLEVYL